MVTVYKYQFPIDDSFTLALPVTEPIEFTTIEKILDKYGEELPSWL